LCSEKLHLGNPHFEKTCSTTATNINYTQSWKLILSVFERILSATKIWTPSYKMFIMPFDSQWRQDVDFGVITPVLAYL